MKNLLDRSSLQKGLKTEETFDSVKFSALGPSLVDMSIILVLKCKDRVGRFIGHSCTRAQGVLIVSRPESERVEQPVYQDGGKPPPTRVEQRGNSHTI
jgi:hypothetical protein